MTTQAILKKHLQIDPVEIIQGTIERITFHNEDSGFCVLRMKVSGFKDLVTLVGNIASVGVGEYIHATGSWINNKTYGQQFKATSVKITKPNSLEGIQKYLGSGMIKGIGPKNAEKLVDKFGKNVFDIIEYHPYRLKEIPGIGQYRIDMITQAWQEQKIIREIMLFLHSHNVSQSRATRIFKTYGQKSIDKILENPYQLAKDIRGIGFLSADKIAQNIGIDKNSIIRARAGLRFALFEAMERGHCGLPQNDLIESASVLVDIEKEILQDALTQALEDTEFVCVTIDDTVCIFLSTLYFSEQNIAKKLHALLSQPLPWEGKPFKITSAITLSDSQKNAIDVALHSKVLVITGGPGVGKTTLVNTLLDILKDQNINIMLAAPTGRAAKRLFESTKREAKTLHRLLETNPATGKFSRNEDRPLACDLLVVDEASMIDVPLMNALLKAVPPSCALFFVGDVDQLPSVGPGKVLLSLIESAVIPVVTLTEVFRQASSSKIIQSAHRINKGYLPDLESSKTALSDFYYMESATQEDCLEKIMMMLDRIESRFGFSPIKDVQILSPQARGVIGTRHLNETLQKKLNAQNLENSITRFGVRFAVGDKVMQIQNNYDKDVYNGDIGFVESINTEESSLKVVFDEKTVLYEFNELDELVLSYATTIHKSQGSEYPAIIIPLMMTHYMMLKRNLIYTGITRGKKLVLVIGEKKALSIAVHSKDMQKRWSSLTQAIHPVFKTTT
ncbi:MAG: ATP-dependent RecD-like DNA helicase [Holosporales bacterium]